MSTAGSSPVPPYIPKARFTVKKIASTRVSGAIACLGVLWVIMCAPVLKAQSCPLPPAIQPIPRGLNMFTEAQEADLGDAEAEYVMRKYEVIEDDDLNGYLEGIAQRILEHMPPTEFRFQLHLIEMPEMNAFSLIGGRVYVSRKLVAFAHNEDEVAGVLAHEMGHIVTHQGAIAFTRRFREVLGIRQVGDRSDVFSKFQQYVENYARKPNRGETFDEEEQHQYVADQVGLYATARAGYNPRALSDLYDRFVENRGKTGSWLSDFLGTISPESKRFRVMLKNTVVMPGGCSERVSAVRDTEFQQWQAAVIAYSGSMRKEVLPGLVSKTTLDDRLRQDISWLRFSPDGRYLLAQDNSGIHVLTREPLAVVFYIHAPGANPASFSLDSKSIVFYNPGLRIETWNIAEQKRIAVHEITLRKQCMQSALSPDGVTLACFTWDLELFLVDVASGSTIYSKKDFYVPSFLEFIRLYASAVSGTPMMVVHMGFSPDSRYFFAGNLNSGHLAFDIPARHDASLPGSIRDMTTGSFAFIGADRVVAINRLTPQRSHVFRFPSGERIEDVPLGNKDIEAAAHGDCLLVRPLKDYAVGVFDLKTKKFVATSRNKAMDVYDDIAVAERVTGELGLYKPDVSGPIATIQLPQGPLGGLKAAAISSDGSYLAMSGPTRGGVWDLNRNRRLLSIRGFHGAWFDDSNVLYADFPEFHEAKRQIGRLDLATLGGTQAHEIGDSAARQQGPLLIVTTPRKSTNARRDADLEVRDVRSGKVLWARYFPKEVPEITVAGSAMSLSWPITLGAAKEELEKNPELRAHAEKEDILVEALDAGDGKPLGQLVISTGKHSFSVSHVATIGDWVIVSTASNLVLAYSLSSKQEKGQVFGTRPVLSLSAHQLAVENTHREITLYDITNWKEVRHLVFSNNIAYKSFSNDGKTLFIVTDHQDLYRIAVGFPATTGPSS